MAAFGARSGGTGTNVDQQGDVAFPNMPTDSISCISINGTVNTPTSILIAGSWDSTLTCWELSYNGQQVSNIQHRGNIKHDGPVLCSDFMSDQQTTFSGGADGTVRMWNVTSGPQGMQTIGKHDQPVRCVKWMPELNCVASASWDKSIRLWDCRQPNAAMTIQLNERVYAMDASGKIVVAATADNQIHCWADVTQNTQKFEYKTPLNYQTRCLSIFADKAGFAIGSIEGRVAIEYFSELVAKNTHGAEKPTNLQSFVFKCHRDGQDIYAVNCIDFYPTNKFLTAGSDGTIVWWDKDARNRLAIRDRFKKEVPIAAAKFSPNGASMFYAASYDWSKGADAATTMQTNQIMHHSVKPDDIATKKK